MTRHKYSIFDAPRQSFRTAAEAADKPSAEPIAKPAKRGRPLGSKNKPKTEAKGFGAALVKVATQPMSHERGPVELKTPPPVGLQGPAEPGPPQDPVLRNLLNSQAPPKVGADGKTKPFRISARRIFLTYAQVPEDSQLEELLDELRSKLVFAHYIVGAERHKDGNKHFHAIIAGAAGKSRKFNIKSATLLDVTLGKEGKLCHGHYVPVKFDRLAVEYCTKEGNYIAEFPGLDFETGKLLSPAEMIVKSIAATGRNATLVQYLKDNPDTAIGKNVNLTNLSKTVKLVEELNSAEATTAKQSIFKIEDFEPNAELDLWFSQAKIPGAYAPVLMVIGRAGSGKSEIVYRLLEDHDMHRNSLQVGHLEGLTKLAGQNVVLLDDFDFTSINENQLHSLFDTESKREIRVLRDIRYREENARVICTANESRLIPIKKWLADRRISRRIMMVQVGDLHLKRDAIDRENAARAALKQQNRTVFATHEQAIQERNHEILKNLEFAAQRDTLLPNDEQPPKRSYKNKKPKG